MESKLSIGAPTPTTPIPPPSVDQATQTELPPAKTTITTNNQFTSVETQTEPDNASTIQQLEEDIASYKAIAEKAKERLEETRHTAKQREATLRKTIADQRAQLKDVDDKLNTAISSFQDRATRQIATLTRELKATQASSSMFLVKYETAEKERARLYEELLEHQTMGMCECEAEHPRHTTEMDKATQEIGHKIDQIIAETEARIMRISTTNNIQL